MKNEMMTICHSPCVYDVYAIVTLLTYKYRTGQHIELDNSIICSCRCIRCKDTNLISFSYTASDGFNDMHHTCLSCGTHFNHLDGETYVDCKLCIPR